MFTSLRSLLVLLCVCPSLAFVERTSALPAPSNRNSFPSRRVNHHHYQPTSSTLLIPKFDTSMPSPSSTALSDLRGGASELLATVTSNLQVPGGLAIATLSGVASAIVVPLTLYRRTWSFSVGYGLSIFGMGLSLLLSHMKQGEILWKEPQFLLLGAVMFYGLRLASYLFVRQQVSSKINKLMKEGDEKDSDKNRLQRIPFALAVSLFYSFMTTPAMYALGAPAVSADWMKKVVYGGAGLAWFGALLEAVADGHKLRNKMKALSKDDEDKFVGPTGGVYQVCRHPNYLGEILYWIGVFVGGAPSFKKDIPAWLCSSLGVYGIVSLMMGAAKRLDKKQSDRYAGQEKFDEWNKSVKSSIIPFAV